MVTERSENKLIGKTCHWSTKTVILEEFDTALKRGWNILFNQISSMTVEISGLHVSQI